LLQGCSVDAAAPLASAIERATMRAGPRAVCSISHVHGDDGLDARFSRT
jgi:hypothetical protein